MTTHPFDPSKIVFPEHVMAKLLLEAEMALRSPEAQVMFYVLDALKSYPLKKAPTDAPARTGRDKKAETNGTVEAAV